MYALVILMMTMVQCSQLLPCTMQNNGIRYVVRSPLSLSMKARNGLGTRIVIRLEFDLGIVYELVRTMTMLYIGSGMCDRVLLAVSYHLVC